LLYIFFVVSKTYYKINTEINFIQDAEILKRHISNDFKLTDKVDICTAYDFSCFTKIPEKIQKKMLSGVIHNGSSILIIKTQEPINSVLVYYLANNKIMRDDIVTKSISIVDKINIFSVEVINKHKYDLKLGFKDDKNINIIFTKRVFRSNV
jgi:hypothetical protein